MNISLVDPRKFSAGMPNHNIVLKQATCDLNMTNNINDKNLLHKLIINLLKNSQDLQLCAVVRHTCATRPCPALPGIFAMIGFPQITGKMQ